MQSADTLTVKRLLLTQRRPSRLSVAQSLIQPFRAAFSVMAGCSDLLETRETPSRAMWAGSQPVCNLDADMCTIAAMTDNRCCDMRSTKRVHNEALCHDARVPSLNFTGQA